MATLGRGRTSADIVIVVGTSSIVYPAAGLPEMAVANGTVVIEVNPEPTPLSPATVSLRETAAGAAARLLQRLPAHVGSPEAASGRFDRAADRELRHRQRHPRRDVHSRRAPATSNPRTDDAVFGIPMRVAVAEQPRPERGVGELLQSRTGSAAGDMLEVPKLTARAQQRKQLAQHIFGLLDRTQHERADHRVERLTPPRRDVLLDRVGADDHG